MDVAAVRQGEDWIVGIDPDDIVCCCGAEAFTVLDSQRAGWWVAWLAYDLGRAVEKVVPRIVDDLPLPDACFARFDARLVVSAGGLHVVGEKSVARRRLIALRDRVAQPSGLRRADPTSLRHWTSSLTRPHYEEAVVAAQELIEAGHCYQVNVARRLECPNRADPISLFATLVDQNPAPHSALVKVGDVAVVSASPERFLVRRGRHLATMPIKGTSADPRALARSSKDRAENVMIVDLARNDLGRVCQPGTVQVPSLCRVEAHPGLYHLVSAVEGTLRPATTTGAVIRATFPPASITGAPKPRVLQAIEDLESCRRGIYCGAVGWIDMDTDSFDLNVAIRTFTVARGRTTFGVGGGIVADSRPDAEWDETELKARRLIAIASGSSSSGA